MALLAAETITDDLDDRDFSQVDRQLLHHLGADGRMTNRELAERVHLSQSATLRRVRRLEERGVIAGYVAVLDRTAVGRGTSVFVEITLDGQSDTHLDAFEEAVTHCPDVLSCHLMAGDFDYLLHVACADVAGYEQTHRQQLAHLPHVARLRSSFALRSVLDRPTSDLL
jgi:Lrp/AsnC family transcriptional regulator, leucine-responsive regulatory protein